MLADVGDSQSLVQNLSTFSGHMRRIQAILEEATPSSLVILDEVGAGTDPVEGSALGVALLRSLAGMSSNFCGARLTVCYQQSLLSCWKFP